MPNSNKQVIDRRQKRQERICEGSRAIEYFLCAAALVAALIMTWTPTALRSSPPPVYFMINQVFSAMAIGLLIGVVPFVHFIGLCFSSCQKCDKRHSDIECSREKWGSYFRYWGAKGQFCVWLFLSVVFALLWLQKGEVTLASGLCPLFAIASSVVSYCVSGERSRRLVQLEASKMLREKAAQV